MFVQWVRVARFSKLHENDNKKREVSYYMYMANDVEVAGELSNEKGPLGQSSEDVQK